MSEQYTFVAVFLLFVLLFATAPVLIGWLFSPKKASVRKQEHYESGLQTYGKTWIEFKSQYYLFALAYVVFAVEAALLLPWAVAYHVLPLYGVIEAVVFLLILGFGLIYV
ncbi:MAG: NADH-quinone oxidoreductase subunit A, partial [Anaerolineae bacterium]|nr:NADH-quinone oxidoreductase subunit A [Anaerolineae bacterium]